MGKYNLQAKMKIVHLVEKIGSITEVSKITGKPTTNIGRWHRRHKKGQSLEPKCLVTSLNHNFFETINTEEKAWLLGFIVADGCISKVTPERKSYRIRFGVALQDEEILHKIKEILSSNHNLYYPKNHKSVQLNINSKTMWNHLRDLGIKPNKTLREKPIYISNSLQHHFWRGVFDGDGSIFMDDRRLNQSSCYNIALIGTKEICIAFSKFLGYKGKLVIPSKMMFTFRKRGNESCYLAYKRLYKDATIFLKRKYKVFRELAETKERQLTLF